MVWPEDNLHGDVADEYFGALYTEHAHVQVLVYDVGRGRVVPRGRVLLQSSSDPVVGHGPTPVTRGAQISSHIPGDLWCRFGQAEQ